MRTRENIEKRLETITEELGGLSMLLSDNSAYSGMTTYTLGVIVELLLDIRDLLSKDAAKR